ncbi:caspase family protein [Pedobacter ginsengisoli]|uniref:caspase family protein n=1 Tax=Pedobacter ginsengisoli TaxID=363852 RepID=UPI00254DC361|nr:caspase family protein [Pedobacter ginsengisoli]
MKLIANQFEKSIKTRYLLTLVLIIFSLNVIGQARYKAETDAMAIIKGAEKLRKDGRVLEADKMVFDANEAYPLPFSLDEIARDKLKLGDVKGANKLWDAAIYRIRQLAVNKEPYNGQKASNTLGYLYYSQINSNFTSGDTKIGVEVTCNFVKDINDGFAAKTNFEAIVFLAVENAYLLNDFNSLKLLYDTSVKIGSERGTVTAKAYLLISEKKYDEAISYLNDIAEKGAGFMMSKNLAKYILVLAYSSKGDYQNMSLTIDKVAKGFAMTDRTMGNYYGLRALYNKEYDKAVGFFTEAMKPARFLSITVERPGKFRFYTNRAEAYIGLKDFVLAKKDYEAALVLAPDYQPALDGLAKLEGSQAVARKTDKTGPEIKILEPANMRGLIVVATGKDIMIKGKAIDPSGLKSATINGLDVYAKEEGDFWGSVILKDGINKIEIVVTDLAGNPTKQIFEIEKTKAPVDAVPIAVTEKQGKNYAIFIASQNYDDAAIPSLENPIADAIKLKLILKNSYNFSEDNIYTLFNPQRDDFKKKFLELREALQPEDKLVIFYAGHGIWVDKEKKGYWLLTDAQRNDVNTWLPNKNVLDMIAELPARHTLLITDACFSGSVFKSRGIGTDAPAAIREMDSKITRVAITSGNDTEVPDVSVFMKYLVKALSENKEKYLTAQKMFINQIIEAVMTESKTEPRYGTLELAGHIGGDFIFTHK